MIGSLELLEKNSFKRKKHTRQDILIQKCLMSDQYIVTG